MILKPFIPYILGAAVAVIAGLGVQNALLRHENDDLKSSLQFEKTKSLSCDARVSSIIKDKQSDATVTDPSVFNPPDGWFLPESQH